MTLENIYKLLLSFDEVYDIMLEKEKKDIISYLIKEVQIYPKDEQAIMPLKSITLNFPIYIDNKEVNKLPWDKQGSIDTLGLIPFRQHLKQSIQQVFRTFLQVRQFQRQLIFHVELTFYRLQLCVLLPFVRVKTYSRL